MGLHLRERVQQPVWRLRPQLNTASAPARPLWRSHDDAIADEHALALLVLILAMGLVLRTLQLDVPMSAAEAIEGASARGVLRSGLPLLPTGLLDGRAPLYHTLLAGAFALGGDSLLSGRLLGVAGGVLAIGGIALLGWRLFQSRAVGLLAALLLAVDPFSVAATARMGPVGILQLGVVAALLGVAHQWLGPAAARARWKLGSALAICLAALAHPLFLVVVPGLPLLVLAGRPPRAGWRPLVPLAVGGAIVALVPLAVHSLAARRADFSGIVRWGGGDALTLGGVAAARQGWWQRLVELLQGLGPTSTSGALVTGLCLVVAATAVITLARTPARARPAMRLVACAAPTALGLALWPSGLGTPGAGALLSPLVILLLAAAVLPPTRESFTRSSLAWAGVAALGATAASAAWLSPPNAPLWAARYALLVIPLVAGVVLTALEGQASSPRPLRGALLGAALAAVIALDSGLVRRSDPGWHAAGLAVAPAIETAGHLVVHGAEAPTVWWSTGRVHVVIPAWDTLYAVNRSGQPFEAVTGAVVAQDRAHLRELLQGPTTYLTTAPRQSPDPAWSERVEAPLDAWLRERLPVQRRFGAVELRSGALPPARQ